MKIIKMKCQSCGANLEVDPNREYMFCKYCGEKQLIDDGTIRVEINNVIRDEAQIKHEEVNMKNAEIKELKMQADAESKTRTALLIALGVIWFLIIVLGIISIVLLK